MTGLPSIDFDLPGKDRDYLEFKLSLLPIEVFNRFGCLHCEHRGTPKCEYINYSDPESPLQPPSEGICSERIKWLLSLSPDYKEPPSLARFNRDFGIAISQPRILSYYENEQKLTEQLNRMTYDPDDRVYLHLRKERDRYHRMWTKLLTQVLHLEDQQVNRDTPKKVEQTVKTLSLTDMQNIMRKNFPKQKGEITDES